MTRTIKLPRVPLPRQRGGAHGGAKPRELSAREELTLALNELAQEDSEEDAAQRMDTLAEHFPGYKDYLDSLEEAR